MSGAEAEEEESPSTPQPLIPSLPDDVALNCLARVPTIHHPSLSAASKPIRALISSADFFAARALLGTARPLLHLSLRRRDSPTNSWFVLHPGTPRLAPLPPLPAPSIGAAYAVSGHQIFALGGSLADVPSSHVWILDCRARSWRPGPPMRVGREFAAAAAVNGRVYVLGGCAGDTSWARTAHWAEALDPKLALWKPVPSTAQARGKRWMHASAVVEGRVYAMADRGGVVFEPASGEWGEVGGELDNGWRGRACVIDGVIYCYDYLGKIRGFDVAVAGPGGVWKEVEISGGVLPKFLCGATMADVGGRLAVVWEEKGKEKGVIGIWCAEIQVRRTARGGLLGNLLWSVKVGSPPDASSIVHCVAVSL